MAEKQDQELEAVKVFMRNLSTAAKKVARKGKENPCYSNCDCYVELELTIAAGKAGYRYGM